MSRLKSAWLPTLNALSLVERRHAWPLMWGVLLLLILGLQVRLWSGEGSFVQAAHLQRQIEQQHQENTRLQARNQALIAEVLELQQGGAALEERARAQLGMVHPAETFYLFSRH